MEHRFSGGSCIKQIWFCKTQTCLWPKWFEGDKSEEKLATGRHTVHLRNVWDIIRHSRDLVRDMGMNVFLLMFPVHNTDGSAFFVSFLQIRCIFQKRTSASPILFWPYGIMSIGRSCKLLLARSTCEWTRKKHVYCLMFWNWASWIILRLHPLLSEHLPPSGKSSLPWRHANIKERCQLLFGTLAQVFQLFIFSFFLFGLCHLSCWRCVFVVSNNHQIYSKLIEDETQSGSIVCFRGVGIQSSMPTDHEMFC